MIWTHFKPNSMIVMNLKSAGVHKAWRTLAGRSEGTGLFATSHFWKPERRTGVPKAGVSWNSLGFVEALNV